MPLPAPYSRSNRPAFAGIGKLASIIGCIIGLNAVSLAPSYAQLEIVSRDLYEERARNEGNRIAFCLRPVGPLARFEAELAEQIGKVLLTQVRTHTLNERSFPVRPSAFDYPFGLTDDQMFITMAQNCDVILGMHLTAGLANWLRLSRPYLTASVYAVSRDPALDTLDDLTENHRIGTQAMAAGDAGLMAVLAMREAGTAPERVTFRTNEALHSALADGTVDAALIWEGAIMAGTDGDPSQFHRMAELPFPTDKILVSAAVRSEDKFLGVLIDEAIGALEADGTLHEMALRHKILWSDAP